MKILLGLSLLVLALPAIAGLPVPRQFEIVCRSTAAPQRVMATLRYLMADESLTAIGSVQTAYSNKMINAYVSVDGLDLRFNWDDDGKDSDRFAIVVKPDLSMFYDFNFADANGIAQPREYLRCSAAVEVPIQ